MSSRTGMDRPPDPGTADYIEALLKRSRDPNGRAAQRAKAQLDEMRHLHPQYFDRLGIYRRPRFAAPPSDWDDEWLMRRMSSFLDDDAIAVIAAADDQGGRFRVPPRSGLSHYWAVHDDNMPMIRPGWLTDLGEAARDLLHRRRADFDEFRRESLRDREMEEFDKAVRYIDELDRRPGAWRASDIIKIHYYIILTRESVWPGQGHELAAKNWLIGCLNRARRRYRAGYYANPLGDPVPRPGVTPIPLDQIEERL